MRQCNITLEDVEKNNLNITPQVGLEPTTIRLTAERSTTELLKKTKNIIQDYNINYKITKFNFI